MTARKILLVEDNPAYQEMIFRVTRDLSKDIEVTPALTAESAQESMEQEGLPHLLLLDLNLPKMSGHEFLEILRKDEKYDNLPIIVLTSSSDAQELEELRDIGASGCFTKPKDYFTFNSMMRFISSEWLN